MDLKWKHTDSNIRRRWGVGFDLVVNNLSPGRSTDHKPELEVWGKGSVTDLETKIDLPGIERERIVISGL